MDQKRWIRKDEGKKDKEKMTKIQKSKKHKYIRTAVEKYKRETGNHLRADIGIMKIAKAIVGNKDQNKIVSKKASWEFIIKYCEGEILISSRIKKFRNGLRKPNCIDQPKNNDEYSLDKARELYKSREWRELRVKIIEEQRGECQMCGRSHRKHGVTIHVDHILPLSIDWRRRFDKTNLQILCEDCNIGKSNHYITDWRQD
jgi:5-methylcytosine-specific restriction endonuclease McrA